MKSRSGSVAIVIFVVVLVLAAVGIIAWMHYSSQPGISLENTGSSTSTSVTTITPLQSPATTTPAVVAKKPVRPVTIQVDSSTSAAGHIQTGSTGNSLLTFGITNPNSDPVKITALRANTGYYVSSTITLSGATGSGGVEEYNNVALYNITGGARVLIGTFPVFSLSTSSLTFGFNSIIYPSNFVIPADTTGKYLITGDVASYRALPAVVGSNAGITIIGSSVVTPQGVAEKIPGTSAIDGNTNVIVGVSGYAMGNEMAIVQGQ